MYSMVPVKRSSIYFVTGTNTGVGKTVLACWLTRYLSSAKAPAVGLKPICSGGRDDAIQLREASGKVLSLDETNPWHFCSPLAPLLAARRDRQIVRLRDVLGHTRRIQRRFPTLLIEGAGGLLTPLSEDFDARDLIRQLGAIPIVVCTNQLGAINQVRLVLAALPKAFSRCAQIVLMSTSRPDIASQSNKSLLAELFGQERIHVFPWLKSPNSSDRTIAHRQIRLVMRTLVQSAEPPRALRRAYGK
jgi:dethiobiotin synthetase